MDAQLGHVSGYWDGCATRHTLVDTGMDVETEDKLVDSGMDVRLGEGYFSVSLGKADCPHGESHEILKMADTSVTRR
ncbi:hypothetical protein RRG08_042826 [Elysia crispata]|uniref:Uncharacterized protein n=1 Tax=Elysia crispata TaxID=231223 RepID=A0AAE1AAA8_9GAST|nr:hypothetical protein RRG08_042826 [Elysia crispata]